MSHFTVNVIGDNPQKLLAPYQENNTEDCPRQCLKFYDIEDEYLKKWKLNPTHRKKYETFERYMREYHGYEERDRERKRYGYWENPNAKWDWYVLGGRWTGFFKLKSLDLPGETGRGGVFGNEPKSELWVDQCKIKNVDIEGMIADSENCAAIHYDNITRIFGGEIPKMTVKWDDLSELDVAQKQEIYFNQPAYKKLDQLRNSKMISDEDKRFLMFLDLAEYQINRDEYIKHAGEGALTTFAIIKDGVWYEQGRMGWFGIVTDEKDDATWNRECTKLLKNLPGDTLVSLYDCHI